MSVFPWKISSEPPSYIFTKIEHEVGISIKELEKNDIWSTLRRGAAHGCIPLDGNVAHKLVADEVRIVRKGNEVAGKRAYKRHGVCDICVIVCERRAVGGEKVSVVMWRDAGLSG